jgi:hypothetical protein
VTSPERPTPPVFDPGADPDGRDGGSDLADDVPFAGHADLLRERIDGATGV